MLLVDATVGPSAIQGLGLFANQFIPKGTKIWVFAEGFDVELTDAQIEKLSLAAQKQVSKYAYRYPGTETHLLCGDDSRFTNHSSDPNTRCRDDHTYATRDIKAGEEITSDYAEFDVRYPNGIPESDS